MEKLVLRYRVVHAERKRTSATRSIPDSRPTNSCTCASIWIRNVSTAMPATKWFAGVALKVDLMNPLHVGAEVRNQEIYPGFVSRSDITRSPNRGIRGWPIKNRKFLIFTIRNRKFLIFTAVHVLKMLTRIF